MPRLLAQIMGPPSEDPRSAQGPAHRTILPLSVLRFLYLQAHITPPDPAHRMEFPIELKREDKPLLDGH